MLEGPGTPLNANSFQVLTGDTSVFDANAVAAAAQQIEFEPAVTTTFDQFAQSADPSAQYVQVSLLDTLLEQAILYGWFYWFACNNFQIVSAQGDQLSQFQIVSNPDQFNTAVLPEG